MIDDSPKEPSDRIWEYSIAIKLSQRAYIPFVFVLANLFVWILLTLYETDRGAFQSSDLSRELLLIIAGAKVNELIAQGEIWRLFTSIFLHGSLLHLILNCAGIYLLGHFAANIYGSKKFSLIYILSGMGGSIFSFLFSTPPSVGSSGAIFGLLGGITVFGVRKRALLPHSFKRFLVVAPIFWMVINFMYGFADPNVDNAAHLGGLLSGTLASFLLGDALFSRRMKTGVGTGALAAAIALFAAFSLYKSANNLMLKFSIKTPQISLMSFGSLSLPYPSGWAIGIHSGGRCLEIPHNGMKIEELFMEYNLCFIDPYYTLYIIGSNSNTLICPPAESLLSGRYPQDKPFERRTAERIEYYFPFSHNICGFLSIPSIIKEKYDETVKAIFRRYDRNLIIL